jgi:hypothetical protein
MARGQERIPNAHSSALETISKLGKAEETETVTPSATVVNLPQPEATEEQEEKQETKQTPKRYKKLPTENFFAWLATIPFNIWPRLDLYIYKQELKNQLPSGQPRYIAKIHQPIDEEFIKANYVPSFGDGVYELQLSSRVPIVASESTIIDIASDPNNPVITPVMASGVNGRFVNQQGVMSDAGTVKATEASSRMLEHSAIAAVDLLKNNQLQAAAPVDIAGIVTAVAALIPKKDDSAIITMLDNQRKDAEARAEREAKDAKDRQERSDKDAKERQDRIEKEAKERADRIEKDAKDREERQDKYNSALMTQQKEFFTILMSEKDKKADTLGMGDVLKELFGAFARERLEGGGENIMPGWAGVLQTIVPKVAEAIPAFMAARNGASPQQIQQIQEQQRIAAETQHGPNGGLRQQNPAEPKLLTTEDELNGFIDRLGTYLTGKIQQGRPADPAYMIQVLDEEFLLVANLLENNTKEVIISAIQSAPLGGQLLQIPIAPAFLEELINKLKQPEEEEEQEPELVRVIPQAKSEATGRKKKQAAH